MIELPPAGAGIDGERFLVTRNGEAVDLVRKSLYDEALAELTRVQAAFDQFKNDYDDATDALARLLAEVRRTLAKREAELGPLRGLAVAVGHYRDTLDTASGIEGTFTPELAADDQALRCAEEALYHASAASSRALGAMFDQLDACGHTTPRPDEISAEEAFEALAGEFQQAIADHERQIESLGDDSPDSVRYERTRLAGFKDAVLLFRQFTGRRPAAEVAAEAAGITDALTAAMVLDEAPSPATAHQLITTVEDGDVEVREHLKSDAHRHPRADIVDNPTLLHAAIHEEAADPATDGSRWFAVPHIHVVEDGEPELGRYYPDMPPTLPGETDDQYTNRLTGADRTGRVPYDHRRNRQCSIGWHEECSDPAGVRCECPCHQDGAS